jgi:hypothetical protein
LVKPSLKFGRQVPLALAGLLLFAVGATARPKLFYQASEHIEVLYYSPAHEYLVTHLIRSYENALQFQNRLFHYTPSEKLSVLIEDFEDYGHGGAGTIPANFISIGIEPLSYTYETLPANERMTWIINHESTHIAMMDNPNETDRRWRRVFFGKVLPNENEPISMVYSSLGSPRMYSTRWYHEGIAAFMETWMAGGLGRAMGGYDEMVFRTMVRDDAYIYDVVGLESEGTSIDFQTGVNSYLYGTRFMTWLSKTYGPDKLVAWITRDNDTKGFFFARFKQVYGMPLAEAWKMWMASERQWQEQNLKEIRHYPLTTPKPITEQALGSVSRPYYDPVDKAIYAAVYYPGHLAHIAEIHTDTGKIDHLKDIKGTGLYYVTSLAMDPNQRQLFYATNNDNWRDLHVFDLKTHRAKRLMSNTRVGDLAFDKADRSLWGIRHNNGLSSLVEIGAPYTEVKPRIEYEYGIDLFDIDVSPDGKYLTGALSDLSGKQKLVRFEIEKLRAGDVSNEVLYDFDYNTPGNFVYAPDGRSMYGSSYYTGASNLFRYDFETKKMDVISNAETGLFRPLPLSNGQLIAFEYTAKGLVPGWVPTKTLEDVAAIKYLGMSLVEKYPVLKTWKLPPPSAINSDKLIVKSGLYEPLKNMRLLSGYPVIEGYKDAVVGGARFEFADRLRLAGVDVTVGASPGQGLPTNEQYHAMIDAHYWNWRLTTYYNNSDFYDLFGPTKVSRKGESVKLGYTKTLIGDTPRTLDLNWNIAGYWGIDTLPDYQNVTVPYHSFMEANAGLKYSFIRKTQGGVEEEVGTQSGVYSRLNYAPSGAFPRIWGNYDHGFQTPIDHSPVWLRFAAGKSWGNKTDPFSNFYFGAFGNNYIDHLSIDRYRSYYSFPGVGIDALSGTSFAKVLAEWNLPAVKFRHVGSTWLYANWARLTFFSSGLFTDFGAPTLRQQYANVGTQLDIRIVLFTYMNTTLSGGYAGATDNNGHISTEYMVSFKIM